MNFRKYGQQQVAKYDILVKLRQQFKGFIKRVQKQEFKQSCPSNIYDKLLDKQGKGNFVTVQNIFNFLYYDLSHTCLTCNNPTDFAVEFGRYREFCSQQCMNSNPIISKRRKKTNKLRYGGEPNNHPTIKEKKRRTFLKKYNVDNPSKSESVKAKKRKTSKLKYGVSHWTKTERGKQLISSNNKISNLSRSQALHISFLNTPTKELNRRRTAIETTNIKRYGARNFWSSKAFQRQRVKKCMGKYGVSHHMQDPTISSKCISFGAKWKYINCLGKTLKVQGYEPQVASKIEESISKITARRLNMPKIEYLYEGRRKIYFPDFKVRTKSGKTRIIEVKSTFTLLNPKNKPKFRAAIKVCNSLGYEFWLAVYLPEEEKTVFFQNPTVSKVKIKLSPYL